MAFTGKILLTDQGKALLAAAQVGGKLSYVRFVLGDGMPMEDMPNHVISPRVEVPVSSVVRDQRNQVIITGLFKNTKLAQGFAWREFGLYATGDNEATQVLYAYGVVADGDFIPAGENVDLVEILLRYTAKVDNAPNVTLVVDDSLIGMTIDQIQAAMNGMLREVARTTMTITTEGWEEGADGIFRKTVDLPGATLSRDRRAWLSVRPPWEGIIGVIGATMGDGTLVLRLDQAPEMPFGVDFFLFETYRLEDISGTSTDIGQLWAAIQGMLREVEASTLIITTDGWEAVDEVVYRKTVPLPGASLSNDRHVWLDVPAPWEGTVGILGGDMGDNALTLRLNEKPGAPFVVRALLFDTFRSTEV